MAFQIRKISNASGAALMMVLIVVVVMGIVALTILSQSMSQTKTAYSQVDQIVAEQLLKGAFWSSVSKTNPGGVVNAAPAAVKLNGKWFTPAVDQPAGTSKVTVSVAY